MKEGALYVAAVAERVEGIILATSNGTQYRLCELPNNWKWAERKDGSYFVNPIDEVEFKVKHALL